MQAKTHITTTLALGLPLMSLTNELTLVNVGVLAVGSLLPDIDHPSSYLGKRHKMVSSVTNKAFGHRGITHSLLGFILIGIIVKFIQKQYLTDGIEDIVFWLMLGYLLHLLEDSFSQRGVKWLYPFTKSGSSFGGKFAFYKTGQLSEYLVMGFMLCLLLMEVRLFWLGNLNRLLPGVVADILKTLILKVQDILNSY